jgi:3-oxoacyl-[acyl-carrier protein] reductase
MDEGRSAMYDVKGKVAVVTGSATGIGRAAALMLAERGCGVVINYTQSEAEARQTADEARGYGVPVLVHRCDISSDAAVREMMKRTADELGRLDVLIFNAGTAVRVPHEDLEGLTEEIWDRILAVNVKGTYFCIRAAVPYMRAQGAGAIAITGAGAGVFGGGSSIAYAASKGALLTMTMSLARVLAPEIRINIASPSGVETRWMPRLIGEEAWDQSRARQRETGLLRRMTTAEDVAEVLVSLITNSDMVTGQNVNIGGTHFGR